MSELSVSRRDDGALLVQRIPPVLAQVLRELPGLLGRDHPESVRRRLFPDPTDDPETAAEWRRAQHPELFALLATARDVVEKDLASMRRMPFSTESRLVVPARHLEAWISALNAARLALGAEWEVTAQDMDPDAAVPPDERGLAILRIDLYAMLQFRLIEEAGPDPRP